ncbi:MAG: DUF4012 domain-containing protein [Xanthomonadaceae bacterium]|nr:DUF4012 domain-containing protein [Rhodospirillaceae bacterium]NIA17609.1 DUF4012 domain-containing protein [Xanthomonadaceae bacterium]
MLKKKKQLITKKINKKNIKRKKNIQSGKEKAKRKKILVPLTIKKKTVKKVVKRNKIELKKKKPMIKIKKAVTKFKKTTKVNSLKKEKAKTVKRKDFNRKNNFKKSKATKSSQQKKIKLEKLHKKSLAPKIEQEKSAQVNLVFSIKKDIRREFDKFFALSIKNNKFEKSNLIGKEKNFEKSPKTLLSNFEKKHFFSNNEKAKIDYDLSVFSQSPHLINIKGKNTNEIKKIIGGENNISKIENKHLKKKPYFFSKKISANKVSKRKVIKQNFLKGYINSGAIFPEDKIGFWKILFFPFYTFFRALEIFFIDLSRIGRGRLPKMFNFALPLRWKKSLAFFVIICFILLLPFETSFLYKVKSYDKGIILGETATALDQLKLGGKFVFQKKLKSADYYFSKSLLNFSKARQNLEDVNSIVVQILQHIPLDGGDVSSGKKLICFGENISKSAVYLNKALETACKHENSEKSNKIFINNKILAGSDLGEGLIKKIKISRNNIILATDELKNAKSNLDLVDFNILPEQERHSLFEIKNDLPILISYLDNFDEFLNFSLKFLGKDNFKRYLIVFQNNYELRATGGFIGSFAMVDIDNGKIKKVEIPEGGSYDLRGGLVKSVSAPEPLYLVSPLWQFHDANWWPDFPTSAKKMMWFYENSGGPTVDGVIALTPQIIIKLLEITGPIEMDKYNETISADNFMWATEYNVELRQNKKEKPKKFIADLSIKLFDKLLNQTGNLNIEKGLPNILTILDKIIKNKDLQLYFSDKEMQNIAQKYGLSGKIKQFEGDYLMVVNSNIAGGKTDGVISQNINLDSSIQKDGSIINQLTIKRKHNGDNQDYFQKVRNVDWIRVYVPKGSQIISASGFRQPEKKYFNKPDSSLNIDEDLSRLEGGFKIDNQSATHIYNQFGKTVFANWSMLDVGETAIIKIKYKLPFKVQKTVFKEDKKNKLMQKYFPFYKKDANLDEDLRSYVFLIQKQAGIDSDFNYKLNIPGNWEKIWDNNSSLSSFSAVLDKDMFFGDIFKVE